MLFHKTTRKFKMRHASNKSGVKPDEKKRISLLCAISMNVSKSIYATNGRQFGWILDQSLMDINAMIIMMMMMMITQQYKHKVAIELTLSRNYNKYDIIIIKAHLWLSLSLLTVCMWVRACHLLLSQFYFVGICNRHNGNTFFVHIIYCILYSEDFSPVSRLITVITVITGCASIYPVCLSLHPPISLWLLWSSFAKLIKNILL